MFHNFTLPNYFKPYSCEQLIRLGNENDGGYLVEKKSLLNSEALLSFGVDHDWSFEEDFKKNNNCIIHTYDGSVGPKFFAKKLKMRFVGTFKNRSREYFNVTKYWIILPFKFYSFFKIFKSHHGPNHYEKYIGNGLDMLNLKQVICNLPSNIKNIFLKIDIENSEYEILDEILKIGHLLTGLVVEFHSVNKNIEVVENFIKSFQLKLVHIHINNYGLLVNEDIPDVVELSFSKFFESTKINSSLPHKLDQKNNIESWSYELNFET